MKNRPAEKAELVRLKLEKLMLTHNMQERISGGTLVALSGGADSVLLLHLLREKAERDGFLLFAAHINHGIRGSEATRDELFCKELCERLSVPFVCRRFDVPAIAKMRGMGLEETARAVRYEALSEIKREHGLSVIATAHNATDDAETVLFHLLRGTGLRGACGIPPVRGDLIRPLLSVTRAEIEEAVAACGLSYVNDSTNTDQTYTRNFLRHSILGELATRFPSPDALIARSAKNLLCDADYIDGAARSILEQKKIFDRVERSVLNEMHPAIAQRTVAFMYANAGGTAMPERVHFEKLLSLCRGDSVTFQLSFPDGIHAECRDGTVRFGENREEYPFYSIRLQMGENRLPSKDVLYLLREGEGVPQGYEDEYSLYAVGRLGGVDAGDELYARSRLPGDAYRYGGMTRRLKKLFNEAKLPHALRERIPVVCNGDEICWVPGFGARDEKQKNKLCAYFYIYGGKDE